MDCKARTQAGPATGSPEPETTARLQRAEVEALRFQARLRQLRQINTALDAAGITCWLERDAKAGALERYLRRAEMERIKTGADTLSQMAGRTLREIDRATVQIKRQSGLRMARAALTTGGARPDNGLFSRAGRVLRGKPGRRLIERPWQRFHAGVFGGEDRLYFPLRKADNRSETQEEISNFLARSGYSIVDYAAGTATDTAGKQRYRIGRLLARVGAGGLAAAFRDDPARSGKDDMLVVFSRHPWDTARISHNRGWDSCTRTQYSGLSGRPGVNSSLAPCLRQGSISAWLIRSSDPDIRDPLARIQIKRATNPETGASIMVPDAWSYGLPSPDFRATVTALCEELFNDGLYGRFRLGDGVYNDGNFHQERRTVWRFEPDMPFETLLRRLKIKARDRGNVTVLKGEMAINAPWLQSIPDMRGMALEGHLDLSGCASLTTLQGCPDEVTGSMKLSRCTGLGDLEGAPRIVGGQIALKGTGLARLDGLPDAAPDISLDEQFLADPEKAAAQIEDMQANWDRLNSIHSATRKNRLKLPLLRGASLS